MDYVRAAEAQYQAWAENMLRSLTPQDWERWQAHFKQRMERAIAALPADHREERQRILGLRRGDG